MKFTQNIFFSSFHRKLVGFAGYILDEK